MDARDPGPNGTPLPIVFTCFRANPSMCSTYSQIEDMNLISEIEITFPALPYGRSDIPLTVPFTVPLLGQTAPASPVTVDSYSSVSGTQWSQSLAGPGPHSAHWNPAASPQLNPTGQGSRAIYQKTGLSLNLTGLGALTVFAGFGSTNFFATWNKPGGPVEFAFTLTDDNHGIILSFSRTQNVRGSNNSANPVFTKIRATIPSTTPAALAFNFANVVGYTITASNRAAGDLPWTDFYLDSLTAVPVTVNTGNPANGFVYDLAGLLGTARSSASWQFQQQGALVAASQMWSNATTNFWTNNT